MTSRTIFVAWLLLSFACRKELPDPAAQPATQTVTTTVAGDPSNLKGKSVNTTIPIAKPPVSGCDVKETFTSQEPIDFTMHLTEAPEKLFVSVRILKGDEEIGSARVPAEGKKDVTLRLPKQKPGKYKLEGLWGGNRACEKEIEVRK